MRRAAHLENLTSPKRMGELLVMRTPPNIIRQLDEFRRWRISSASSAPVTHSVASLPTVVAKPIRPETLATVSALFDGVQLLVPAEGGRSSSKEMRSPRKIREVYSGENVNFLIPCNDLLSRELLAGVVCLEVAEPVDGLTAVLENDAIRVSGIPDAESGKHLKIRLVGSYDGQEIGLTAAVCFVFPRIKSIEPDLTQPFPSKNADGFHVVLQGGMRLVGASIRGRNHAEEGSFRDDALGYGTDRENRVICAVVSDGAGSARYSRRGAWRVTNAFVKTLSDDGCVAKLAACADAGDGEKLKSAFATAVLKASESALRGIDEDAHVVSARSSDFSATALVFAVLRLPTDGFLILSFSVGDGLVAVVRDDFSAEILGIPDHGETRSQTVFLSEKTANLEAIARRICARHVSDFKLVCAMTDGVSNPVFPEENGVPPERWKAFCDSIFQTLDSSDPIGSLQRELDFRSPGFNDDRTVVALTGD